MELLDFPPEVFQRIVNDLVQQAGARKAWKYRLVCKTFAREIEWNVFALQPLGVVFPESTWLSVRERPHATQIAYLLKNRMKVPLDANPYLLDKIRNITGILTDGTSDVKALEQWLEDVCDVFASVYRAYGSERLATLIEGKQPLCTFLGYHASKRPHSTDSEDAVAAAAVLGKLDLMVALLSRVSNDIRYTSQFFGNVLHLATSSGTSNHVKAVLVELEKHANRVDLRSQDPFVILSEASISEAIIKTIQQRDQVKMQTLLSFDRKYRAYATKSTYNQWLSEAVRVGQLNTLNTVLNIRIQSHPRVIAKTFALACSQNDAAIVTALLAIRNGNINTVKAVLQAGARPNGPSLRSGYNPSGFMTPLEIAMKADKKDVVQALLDCGATVDLPNSQFSVLELAAGWGMESTYEVLRKAKVESGAEEVPDYISARRMIKIYLKDLGVYEDSSANSI